MQLTEQTDGLHDLTSLSDADLVAAIGAGAARIAALQCRFLLLAAEVDRRRLWAGWGMTSAVAWLSWRCGLDRVTAREHLRVGHALKQLPGIRGTFEAGRLSYSKVRAITRVAEPDDEERWVNVGLAASASQVEELTRGYRTALSIGTAQERAGVRWRWDDEGYLLLTARMAPVEGALVVTALQQAQDALREAVNTTLPPVDSAEAEVPAPAAEAAGRLPAPTLADALALVAHTSLTVGPRPVVGDGSGYEVVVHVNQDSACVDGGSALPATSAQALVCDATITALLSDGEGRVRGVGRRMRRVPAALRRALLERDGRTCRYPGCAHRRWLQAHHVTPWAHGGGTDPDNLVMLCFVHHRALHDGQYLIEALGQQRFRFGAGRGQVIEDAPALGDPWSSRTPPGWLPSVDGGPPPDAIAGTWAGDRLDLHYAVSVFASHRQLLDRRAASRTDQAA